jgi:hypothetical protein
MTFSKIFSAVALGLVAAGSAHSALVIDTFDIGQDSVSVTGAATNNIVAPLTTSAAGVSLYQTNMAGAAGSTNSIVATSADILGLERDIAVARVSGTNRVEAIVDGGGQFVFDQGNSTTGFAIVRWDGAVGDWTNSVKVDGLGGADLSTEGIQILVGTNVDNAGLNYKMTFQVWTETVLNSNVWTLSEVTKTITSNGGDKDVGFMFSDFSGANFARVGAIQMIVNTGAGSAGGLDFSIDIVGAVPEPGSLALAGLALAGLGMAGRRRKAAK